MSDAGLAEIGDARLQRRRPFAPRFLQKQRTRRNWHDGVIMGVAIESGRLDGRQPGLGNPGAGILDLRRHVRPVRLAARHHELLQLANGTSRVEILGTGVGAVHDGVTAEKAERVL